MARVDDGCLPRRGGPCARPQISRSSELADGTSNVQQWAQQKARRGEESRSRWLVMSALLVMFRGGHGRPCPYKLHCY